jgi:glycosyltransferase 2 family protein
VLIPAFALAALALAVYLLRRQLAEYSVADVRDSLAALGPLDLLAAVAFAAGSYFCLTLSETLSVRHAGKRLPYRKVAFTSFVALSLGHNIGFAALSSGAIRYRFYSSWGLTLGDVGRIVVLCGTTVALGHATLAGLALLGRPDLAAELLGLSSGAARAAGAGLLIAIGLYLAAAWRAGGAR